MADPASSTVRVLTFRAGDRQCALMLDDIGTVARLPRLTSVPRAPVALLGLANVRGTVIPVFCAATLLGSGASRPTRMIVLAVVGQAGGEWLGLAVDETGQVVSSAPDNTLHAIDIARLAQQSLPAAAPRRVGTGAATPWREAGDQATMHRLVVFALGDQEFAFPAGCVERVLPLPDRIAVLPDSDAVVIGTAALGSGIVPLLSLGALLSLPMDAPVARPRVVVVRIGSSAVGFVVDLVRGIQALSDAQIDPVPVALRRGRSEARIQAIARPQDNGCLISILAPEHVLRDDLTATMLASADLAETRIPEGDVAATEPFMVFHVGADRFAIPAGAVEAVARLPDRLTVLPRAPAFVLGVMNLAGTAVPVMALGQRLGVQDTSGAGCRVMIVRMGEVQAGFVVDAIAGVVAIEVAAVQPAPDLGARETRIFDRAVNLLGEQRIVLVVSPRELLGQAEHDLLLGLGGKGSTGGP